MAALFFRFRIESTPIKIEQETFSYGRKLQERMRKGVSGKVARAILIKRYTSVSNIWIAERLGMGHDRSVSRLMKQGKTDETTQKQCKQLEKMLQCEDCPPRSNYEAPTCDLQGGFEVR